MCDVTYSFAPWLIRVWRDEFHIFQSSSMFAWHVCHEMIISCVTWLIHVRVTYLFAKWRHFTYSRRFRGTHQTCQNSLHSHGSNVCRDSVMCDVIHSCVTWRIHVCRSFVCDMVHLTNSRRHGGTHQPRSSNVHTRADQMCALTHSCMPWPTHVCHEFTNFKRSWGMRQPRWTNVPSRRSNMCCDSFMYTRDASMYDVTDSCVPWFHIF